MVAGQGGRAVGHKIIELQILTRGIVRATCPQQLSDAAGRLLDITTKGRRRSGRAPPPSLTQVLERVCGVDLSALIFRSTRVKADSAAATAPEQASAVNLREACKQMPNY